MAIPLFKGLRGRLVILVAVPFCILFALATNELIDERDERIVSASEQILSTARLIAAEQRGLAEQARRLLHEVGASPLVLAVRRTPECSQYLADLVRREATLTAISVAAPNGQFLCYSEPGRLDTNIADRDYFQRVLKAKDIVASDVVMARALRRPVILFSRAVRDAATGTVRVVVNIPVEISNLQAELAKSRLPEGARLLLIDGKGTLVARYPDPERMAGRNIAHEPVYHTAVAQGAEGTFRAVGLDGLPRVIAHTPFIATAYGPMHLIIAVPEQIIVASAQRAFMLKVGVTLFLFLATLAVLFWFGDKFFMRPVAALVRAAQKLGTGSLDARTGLSHGSDEFGRLASAFDKMAESLTVADKERLVSSERLAASEGRLRLLFERMPLACMTYDANFRYTSWNPAAEQMFGYQAAEMFGKHVLEVLLPEDEKQHVDLVSHRLSEGDLAAHSINENVTKDRRRIVCEWHNTPLKDASRNFIGVVSLVQDITEQQRAQDRIQESEERLRLAMDAARQGAWSWNIEQDTVTVSEGIGPLFGLSPGNGPRTLEEFLNAVTPEARVRLTEAVAQIRGSGVPSNPEFQVTWSDGSVHWIALHTKIIPDVLGNPVRGVGVAMDITQRKTDAMAIERINRALRTLSSVNAAIVRATVESGLLNAVCKVIVEQGGYRMAWVGISDHDSSPTVRPIASHGYDEGYLQSQLITWDDLDHGCGPTGTAIKSGTTQVNQDVTSNPNMAPWRDAALSRGYLSSISLPLKINNGSRAALTIYAAETNAFNTDEVILLEELAEDFEYGISTIRTRAERDRITYENRHHEERLREGLEEAIQAIATTVEQRDPYTAGHQRRVGVLARAIALELNWLEDRIHGLFLAAIIHDVGKIQVPAEILSKPGKLTDIEFQLIQHHPLAGRDILKDVRFPWPIAEIVWQHHERLDGSGYPRGLKKDEILLEARIMTVADVVEAMASHRPYRPALGIDAALAEIACGRDMTYDPQAVDACLRLFREKGFQLSAA